LLSLTSERCKVGRPGIPKHRRCKAGKKERVSKAQIAEPTHEILEAQVLEAQRRRLREKFGRDWG